MSSAEHDEATAIATPRSSQRVQRGAGVRPGPRGLAPGPRRLDPPGYNCQPREPSTEGVGTQVAELLARVERRRDSESRGSTTWWAELEDVWRVRRRADVARLHRRSERLRRERERELDHDRAQVLDRRARHAESRSTSQAMPRESRLALCRKRWIAFGCACQRIERPVGCDVTLLCEWCRRRHLRRWRKRITKALAAQAKAKHAAWVRDRRPRGREPLVYLMTLTVAHSGDVARDRADLWNGWRAFQKWLCREVSAKFRVTHRTEVIDDVKRKTPHSVVVPEAFHYTAVWEVTEGNDGLGHVHCHVAAVLPYFDWSRANEAWRAGCPRSDNVDFRRAKAEGAAKYLAKYVTKGVQVGEMRADLAGDILASWYGKRRVSTSRGFWRPLLARGKACCRRCESEWRVVEHPHTVRSTSPEGVWLALVERHRVALPRGPTQASLRLDLRGSVGETARRSLHGERP